MASSWQYQHCYVGINSRVASFPLVLALVLGLTAIVTTGTANAQTYTVIHNFMGGADGAEPAYGLTIDSAGTLYGSTFSGDAGTGTIYTLTNQGSSGWSLNTLYMFSGGSDGAVPYAGVIFGPDGSLYGTTAFGGVGSCQTGGGKTGCGTAFNLTSSSQWRGKPSNGWTETVLYDFTGGGDGATPYGGRPIFDGAGNLYGTAFGGGLTNCPGGCGLVYELVPSNGGWTEKILYSFTGKPDGASPWAGVIFDQSGNLYGTTEFGGAYGYGTVFELIPSGSGWTEKVLYSFQNQPDGGQPYAGLIFDSSGNLYGATTSGGAGGGGTVFELSPSGAGWSFQTLYAFTGGQGELAGGPTASLVFDNGGNLYGATAGDGANNFGSVFKLALSSNGTWTYTSLYDFKGGDDGRLPRGNLVFDKYGNLYGTASGGQSLPACDGSPCGVFFEITFPTQYVAVSPCRIVDTRGTNNPIQGGTFQNFAIQGSQGACNNIPATAAAYALNVTVVPNGPLGYLTVWPTGQPQPLVSTINSDGRVKANAAIVPAGNNGGSVSVFATDTTNVILDIAGYFAPASSSTLAFYPVPPCRVADTRNGQFLQGGQEADFTVSGLCNVPASAQSYSLNITAVPRGPLEYLTVWPAGQTQPVVSTLNAPTGTVTANAAIVGAGANGQIAVYPTDDTDLVIDIDGYFAAPGANGLSLYATTPCRVLDTRPPHGNGPFNGTLNPPLDVLSSPCNVPSSAEAYVFNATVVPSGSLGYLTLWPDGIGQPLASTLNAQDGAITSNMAIVPAGNNGEIDAYAYGLTNLILDIFSYFAP